MSFWITLKTFYLCEDTGRPQPSMSQIEKSQKKPTLQIPWLQTSSFQNCEKKYFCCLSNLFFTYSFILAFGFWLKYINWKCSTGTFIPLHLWVLEVMVAEKQNQTSLDLYFSMKDCEIYLYMLVKFVEDQMYSLLEYWDDYVFMAVSQAESGKISLFPCWMKYLQAKCSH